MKSRQELSYANLESSFRTMVHLIDKVMRRKYSSQSLSHPKTCSCKLRKSLTKKPMKDLIRNRTPKLEEKVRKNLTGKKVSL